MKITLFAAAVAISVSLAAHAGGKPKPDPEPTQQQQQKQYQGQNQYAEGGDGGTGYALSRSESRSNARSDADARSSAKNETVVDASSGAAVDVETGDTDISVEGDTEIWDIPSNSAYAPNGYTVIECSAVLGAAYTNRNGSGSLGLPVPRWLDKILFQRIADCEADADAVWLAEMGFRIASIESRCATASMRRQFGQGVRGRKAQRDACIGHLKNTLIEQRDLVEVENRIRTLQAENQRLTDELSRSQEATDRCTDTFVECQQGK